MKKIIYSTLIIFIALWSVSCDENDENNENETETGIAGNWLYNNKPHFEFEYKTDSVTINMGKGTISYDVEYIKTAFTTMATEKMGEYFKGIYFGQDNQLIVKMSLKGGQADTLRASYIQKSNIIQVQLDTNDLKALAGKSMNIPPISFKFVQNEDNMLIYLDQSYIHTFLSMNLDMMIKMITGQDLSTMPDKQAQAMRNMFGKEIGKVMDQVVKLGIGFNLVRE